MGGTIIETESERLIRQGISQGMERGMERGMAQGIEQGMAQGMERGMAQGEAKMLIELGQEYGLDDSAILKRLQDKLGLSLKQATAYLEQYEEP